MMSDSQITAPVLASATNAHAARTGRRPCNERPNPARAGGTHRRLHARDVTIIRSGAVRHAFTKAKQRRPCHPPTRTCRQPPLTLPRRRTVIGRCAACRLDGVADGRQLVDQTVSAPLSSSVTIARKPIGRSGAASTVQPYRPEQLKDKRSWSFRRVSRRGFGVGG